MIIHNFFRSRKAETGVAGSNLVLVLDDNEMVRRCLVRLIRSSGYMVEAYLSAEEFLSASHLDHPLCLVLDATLTGIAVWNCSVGWWMRVATYQSSSCSCLPMTNQACMRVRSAMAPLRSF
jgi:hypothetical protein